MYWSCWEQRECEPVARRRGSYDERKEEDEGSAAAAAGAELGHEPSLHPALPALLPHKCAKNPSSVEPGFPEDASGGREEGKYRLYPLLDDEELVTLFI